MSKIVIISPAHPLRGGIAASSERLAQELVTMGYDVELFSFSLQYPSFLFPGKTQYSDAPPPKGLTIHSTIHSVNPISWVITAFRIIKAKPDRIVTRYWLPFMGPCLGSILLLIRIFGPSKIQRVAFVDNLIPHEKRPGDALFSRYFAWNNQSFVAMSESVRQDIKHFCPNKPVAVSPHPIYDNYGTPVPVDEALTHLGLDKTVHWILFFGFIRAYKGLDLLLKAMADPRIRTANIKLLIAGECYEDWQPYQQLIEDTGISDLVALRTDFISDDQVRYYFSAVYLIAQPYKTATQSGITQIAMHFNKPTLVTNVGGLPEMVSHEQTGYVVEPEPNAIADAVMAHFPKGVPNDLTANIEAEKQRFSWAKLAEAVMNPE